MANESRFNRRCLSDAWIERLKSASNELISVRSVLPSATAESAYVFLTVPEELEDQQEYRAFRRGYLDRYCLVLAWQHNLQRVVGIATEPGLNNPSRSHDFLVFEPNEWTDEMRREAQETQEQLDILYDDKIQVRRLHDDEYPPDSRIRPAKSAVWEESFLPRMARSIGAGRNDACPCGSGLKFKRCCMRRISS